MSLVTSTCVNISPRIPPLVRRGFAVLLGLLIVTPFTAPFSSCPMSLLLHDPAASPQSVPPGGVNMTATAEDDAPPSDAFSVQIEEKAKDETTLRTDTEPSALVVVSIVQEESIVSAAAVPPLVRLVLRV
jgi:hypothetical protein